MPNSYTCLRYHVIFGTKNRLPQLDPSWRDRLHEYIGGIIRDGHGQLLAAGGMPDHVHLLINLHPQTALSDLLRNAKAGSSRWIHETFSSLPKFAWQDGYGAFTVSHSNMPHVTKYIAEQEQHHRQVSFQEEFITFLKRHEVEYDDRYIWR